MGDPFFSLGDLFQWLIILTQTQDYFGFNDAPLNNTQNLQDGLSLHQVIS